MARVVGSDGDPGGDTGDDITMERASSEVVDDPRRAAEPVIVPPMEKPPGIGESGFFDPHDPERAPEIVLTRLVENDREAFRLERPIGYWDAHLGGVIVPANLARFRTDLTSVPRFFTWLVPRTGRHLPAALLHDGLVHRPHEPQTYIADTPIDRVAADRLFRHAMRDLGTSWLRRWLVWTAAATGTMAGGPLRRTLWGKVAVSLMVAVVIALGTAATIDLFDCREALPWMGDRPAWLEVAFGAVGALAVPAALAVLWGRRWAAGVIAGAALALLLHVTVAITIVYALFTAAESAIERQPGRALRWAALAVGASAAIVRLGMWAC